MNEMMDTDKLDAQLRDRLPNECWHHIISFLPRLSRHSLAQLSGFHDLVMDESQLEDRRLIHALRMGTMRWRKVSVRSMQPRLRHGTVNYQDQLVIFGGASSHTPTSGTYNDIWTFDVHRKYQRMTTYDVGPSPRTNFGFVQMGQEQSERLLVVGGRSTPPCAPWWTISDLFEIHMLNPKTGAWTRIQTTGKEPTLPNGIRCCMISPCELLAVGGLIPDFHPDHNYDHQRTLMEVSILRFHHGSLDRGVWHRVAEWSYHRSNPPPRMEPHLVSIGSDHVLMYGGRGAANIYLQDAWIMKIIRHQHPNGYAIRWHPVQIENPLAPPLPTHMFPSCVVGNLLVFTGVRTIMKKPTVDKPKEEPPKAPPEPAPVAPVERRPVVYINQDRPLNTIGAMAAFTVSSAPAPHKIRIHMAPVEPPPDPTPARRLQDYPMRIFVLDLSDIMMDSGHDETFRNDGARIRWLQINNGGLFPGAPELMALGTFTRLDNGIALVGGVRRSLSNDDVLFTQSTNEVYMLHYGDD